ncbi:MAG: ANTAR domain-containing protein [Rhodospirillales bacterium]|nr:ANTAR domain-containing protein [Rhodospirillales bacterium]MDE2575948.1 ANTAR domain-containing protein [Rhodospirillales bacterium]
MKVLLADDEPERAGKLARGLAADPAITVLRLARDEMLADAVARLAPDVVIVDMARPDRDALEGVRQMGRAAPRPVVLFVDADDPAFMEEAIAAGVCSYNAASTPPPDVKPVLRAAVALFRRHQQAEAALARSEQQLAERGLVDRAKARLIREQHLSEPQAHRLLQRRAMASGRRIAEIAADLLAAPEPPARKDPA